MASINDFFQVFLFNASVIVQLKRKLFHRFQHFSSCFFFCFSCAQHLQSIKKQIVNYLVCVTICLICESEYWMGKSSPLTHSVFLKSIQCWDLFSVFFFFTQSTLWLGEIWWNDKKSPKIHNFQKQNHEIKFLKKKKSN